MSPTVLPAGAAAPHSTSRRPTAHRISTVSPSASAQDENLSAVSASSRQEPSARDPSQQSPHASMPSASIRSVASSTSRSFFMNRFFRSQQPADQGMHTAQSLSENQHGIREHELHRDAPTLDSAHTRMKDADPVAAILPLTVHIPASAPLAAPWVSGRSYSAFLVLYESGCIRLFCRDDTSSSFLIASEAQLPSQPGRGLSHFLVSGRGQSAMAIVTADEDPRPHALVVYSVVWNVEDAQLVLTCDLVLRQNGPIDRVVGACPLPHGNGLIVGTDNGRVQYLSIPCGSGDLAPRHVDADRARDRTEAAIIASPKKEIWTLVDDMTSTLYVRRDTERHDQNAKLGLWDTFDLVNTELSERLFAARRFSLPSIAKALRVPHLAQAKREDLVEVGLNLAETSGEDVADRVLHRAQNNSLEFDFDMHCLSLVPNVGVVIARRIGICVLRPMLEIESTALLPDSVGSLFEGLTPLSHDPTAMTLLAAHAVPQVAAVEYMSSEPASDDRDRAACVLSMGLVMSEREVDRSLSELAAIDMLSTPPVRKSSLWESIQDVALKLSQGRAMLQFLYHAREYSALRYASERCSSTLPMSCLFALGVIFIESGPDVRDARADLADQDEAMATDGSDTSHLENAFASFVSAARLFRESRDQEAVSDEDVECVIDLADIQASECLNEMDVDSVPRSPDVIVRHLDFWILERGLRLIEAHGSLKSSAACALEAMSAAPTAKLHELMRAVAFQRFLDMGDLECALRTMLSDTFAGDQSTASIRLGMADADAFRDCIGLLVNAAVDAGQFSWLSNWGLPLPVKELAALALERRARSSDVLPQSYLLQGDHTRYMFGAAESQRAAVEQSRERQFSSPYEHLYVWLVEMGYFAGAATCGLEWYERVSTEGLVLARAASSSLSKSVSGSPIGPLVTWAHAKARALAVTCAAVRQLPSSLQYVNRSRHSLLADYSSVSTHGDRVGTLDLEWLSRRHLLARAQISCLTRRLSSTYGERGLLPGSDYIVGHAQHLLADDEKGVNFVVSSVFAPPITFEKVCSAVDLAIAWVPEHGDNRLVHVIQNAAKVVAGESCGQVQAPGLSSAEMSVLLEMVSLRTKSASTPNSPRRNWYLIAAEGMLSGSNGRAGIPKWCSDGAMWGTKPFGTGVESWEDPSNDTGNPSGMARAFLRYNRACDAAQVLLHLLRIVQREDSQDYRIHVPLNVIDATMVALQHEDEVNGATASEWHRRLEQAIYSYKEYKGVTEDRVYTHDM